MAKHETWAAFMQDLGQQVTLLTENKELMHHRSSYYYERHGLTAPRVTRGKTVAFTFKDETDDTEIGGRGSGITLGMLSPEGRRERDAKRLHDKRVEVYDWLMRHGRQGEFEHDSLMAALEALDFPKPKQQTHVVADVYFTPDKPQRVDFVLPRKVDKRSEVEDALNEKAKDPQEVGLARTVFEDAEVNGVKKVKIVIFDNTLETWADKKTIK